MAEYDICEVAVPASPEVEPSWVLDEVNRIRRARSEEMIGNTDFVEPPADTLRSYAAQDGYDWVTLVAVSGIDAASLPRGDRTGLPLVHYDAALAGPAGTVIAFGTVECPTLDNLHMADVYVQVDAGFRRLGIGTALYTTAVTYARSRGRTVLMHWSDHQPPVDGEARLIPPTNVGALPIDASVRFALRHGYTLEQCERHSVLDLPVDEATLDRIWAEALPHASGYTLRTFSGRIPDDLIDAYVALLVHFTAEEPIAGLELEEENWDVDRVRRMEARRTANGRRVHNTVALHDATGAVAAMTELSCQNKVPGIPFGFQNVTVVDNRHRGHRLGWLVKVANMRAMQADDPGRRRIHTWNAGENQWMLAINDAMGYQPRLVEGAWQKKLA